MTAPAPADGFSVFAALHQQRRAERLRGNAVEDPAVLAGRALGLLSPLTLEGLVTSTHLGALNASPAQLALIRAADGRPANDILSPERTLFHFGCERLPGNDNALIKTGERLPSGRPRLVVLRTGVRAGKTLISVLALLLSVLTCRFRRPPTQDETARGVKPGADGLVGVRPGELVRAVIVAPRLELTRAPFHHLVSTMETSPALKALFTKEPLATSCIIRRPDGNEVEIKCLAADAGGANLRSTWLAGALFDEADFHGDGDAAVNLTENLRACAARMLTGAQIWIPSSPWAEDSPFDKLFREVFKEQFRDGRLAFHSDTISMNPTVNIAEIEAMRRTDPDNAAREYDAIPFGAGTGRFFPEDAITKSVNERRPMTLPPKPGVLHFSGADWGLTKNSSAQAIARPEGSKAVLVFTDELRPTKDASVSPGLTVPRFLGQAMQYGCRTVRGDHYLAPLRREEREKFVAAQESKWNHVPEFEAFDPNREAQAELFSELRRRMLAGEVEIPNDPRLLAQLRGTTVVPQPGGAMKILLPKQGNAHGDLLFAAALALVACAASLTKREPPALPDDGPWWRSSSSGRGFR